MAITIDRATRKEIGIAAAYDDKGLSEWCVEVLGLDVDPFEQIVADALEARIERTGPVAASTSVLLPARGLVEFTVEWLEKRFA